MRKAPTTADFNGCNRGRMVREKKEAVQPLAPPGRLNQWRRGGVWVWIYGRGSGAGQYTNGGYLRIK